nr:hypothetical protein CFP56_22281 [Quercus suber]
MLHHESFILLRFPLHPYDSTHTSHGVSSFVRESGRIWALAMSPGFKAAVPLQGATRFTPGQRCREKHLPKRDRGGQGFPSLPVFLAFSTTGFAIGASLHGPSTPQALESLSSQGHFAFNL